MHQLFYVCLLILLVVGDVQLHNGCPPPLSYASESLSASSNEIHQLIASVSHKSVLQQFPGLVVGHPVPEPSSSSLSYHYLVFTANSSTYDALISSEIPIYIYTPRFKICENLKRDSIYPLTILLQLVPASILQTTNLSPSDILQSLHDVDGVFDCSFYSALSLQCTLSQSSSLQDLAALDFIYWIEHSSPAVPLNQQAKTISYGSFTNFNAFKQRNLDGRGHVIAVTDSGVRVDSCYFTDPNHPPPYNSYNENHRKIVGYRILGDQNEHLSHGTHVVGTITGQNGDFSDGLATGVKVYFTDIGVRDGLISPNVYEILDHHRSTPASIKIDSNSWAFQTSAYTSKSQEADAFAWEHKDYLIIFAGGNDGVSGLSTIMSPSNSKNVLTVGAVSTNIEGAYDTCCNHGAYSLSHIDDYPEEFSEDRVTQYSSRGPTLDFRIKPDIVAVGGYIRSAGSTSSCTSSVSRGTSMATPQVAAAAAVVAQYLKDGFYEGKTISPSAALLKGLLLVGAVDVGQNHRGDLIPRMPSILQGFGRLNLSRSLPLDDSHFLFLSDDLAFDGSAHNYDFYFEITETSVDYPIKIVLTWTDPVASISALFKLVNNLDLTVITPSKEIVYGNMQTLPDIHNVIEAVAFPFTAETGVYRVRVSATSLVESPQPFSLVVSAFKARRLDRHSALVSDFNSKCPNNCYNRGQCQTNSGTCFCESGFRGLFCEFSSCVNNCSGNGRCSGGKCDCYPGFFGCGSKPAKGVIRDRAGNGGLSQHPPGQNCLWSISPSGFNSQSDSIVIDFSYVLLGNGDSLEIRESSPLGELLADINGSDLPETVVTSASTVYVGFNTVSRSGNLGFELRWAVIPKSQTLDPVFNCFGVGTYSDDFMTCDCDSSVFVNSKCSEILCPSEGASLLPMFSLNFEFDGRGLRTSQDSFITDTEETSVFGGSISSIRAHSPQGAPFLGTVSNELAPFCVKSLPLRKRMFGTGDAGFSRIGQENYDISIEFSTLVHGVEVDFYGVSSGSPKVTGRVHLNNGSKCDVSSDVFVTEDQCNASVVAPGNLVSGTFKYFVSDDDTIKVDESVTDLELVNDFDLFLISEIRIKGLCSSFISPCDVC
ncbi:hypothetical protein GEMRC1_000420 [Eukaryota sp. GEM-RC1]